MVVKSKATLVPTSEENALRLVYSDYMLGITK